jgi:hypothetical protein
VGITRIRTALAPGSRTAPTPARMLTKIESELSDPLFHRD